MTTYISCSHWGLFESLEPTSRRFDEDEVMRAKIRQFERGHFSGSEQRGNIVDREG
jgi:hypothetical protein